MKDIKVLGVIVIDDRMDGCYVSKMTHIRWRNK
jgi:hypothetical protein